MAKLISSGLLNRVSGTIGDMVFRQCDGYVSVSERNTKKINWNDPTRAKTVRQQQRFAEAGRYAKEICDDRDKKAAAMLRLGVKTRVHAALVKEYFADVKAGKREWQNPEL